MKTIGARRGQIVGIYLLLIFAFSMIAFLIAVPLASRIAYGLLEVLAGQVNVVLTGFSDGASGGVPDVWHRPGCTPTGRHLPDPARDACLGG